MAIRGANLKINNKELQRTIDNLTAKELTKLVRAGKMALADSVTSGIKQWYKAMGSTSDGGAIIRSLDYNTKVYQKNKFAYADISAIVDMNKYEYQSAHYHIYDYVQRHPDYQINPGSFVLDLQWSQGILGLPEKSFNGRWVNPHFIQGESLYDSVANGLQDEFVRIIRKYLK